MKYNSTFWPINTCNMKIRKMMLSLCQRCGIIYLIYIYNYLRDEHVVRTFFFLRSFFAKIWPCYEAISDTKPDGTHCGKKCLCVKLLGFFLSTIEPNLQVLLGAIVYCKGWRVFLFSVGKSSENSPCILPTHLYSSFFCVYINHTDEQESNSFVIVVNKVLFGDYISSPR